ncbi:MAG: DNA-binding response regulator [Halioglobus sp.]|nr:DNA-binding response regulator [Halioglobus sp.]|tara:strand:+ start:390 stop:1055 length:666 start_codon:yes stop_codon:yes gene_type:complete
MPATHGRSPYTVVIADDHQIVRDGLRTSLQAPGVVEDAGLRVVGEAGDGFEAIACVKAQQPNLLLLDIAMPLAGGAEVLVDIRRWSPDTAIVVLTGISAPGLIASLLELGVDGMFSKGAPLQEMYAKLPLILRGGQYIAAEFTQLLEAQQQRGQLTARERQVLNMIVAGKSNRDIADALSISPKTVDKHRTSLMQKLGVHSIAELMSLALKEGMIDPVNSL